MTASKLYTVFCDHPNCGHWSEYGVGDTAAEARANLRGTEWTLNAPDPDGYHVRRDYCPQHQPTG